MIMVPSTDLRSSLIVVSGTGSFYERDGGVSTMGDRIGVVRPGDG
jgi:hypothetical protein